MWDLGSGPGPCSSARPRGESDEGGRLIVPAYLPTSEGRMVGGNDDQRGGYTYQHPKEGKGQIQIQGGIMDGHSRD